MKITDFVIGLGFDKTDFDRGIKSSINQLSGFKSRVLQIGAALGAAFSVKALTLDFSKQVNQLRQMSDFLGISATELSGLQNAAKSFGANAEELTGFLEWTTKARAAIQVDNTSFFAELAKAGLAIDPLINAKNATEMLYSVADQFGKLTKTQQINVASALGVSPAMIDMLKQGGKQIGDLADKFAAIRPQTKEMQKQSKDLIAGVSELESWTGRYADKLGTGLTTALNRVVSNTNEWLTANHALIDSGVDKFAGFVAEHFEDMAVTLAGIAAGGAIAKIAVQFAGLGKVLSIITKANPWLLGLTAILGIGSAIYSEDRVEENKKAILGATLEEQRASLAEIAASGVSDDSGWDTSDDLPPEIAVLKDKGAAVTPAPGNDVLSGSSVSGQANIVMMKPENGAESQRPITINNTVRVGEQTLKSSVTRIMKESFDATVDRLATGSNM